VEAEVLAHFDYDARRNAGGTTGEVLTNTKDA